MTANNIRPPKSNSQTLGELPFNEAPASCEYVLPQTRVVSSARSRCAARPDRNCWKRLTAPSLSCCRAAARPVFTAPRAARRRLPRRPRRVCCTLTHLLLCYTKYVTPFYTDTDPKMEALQVQLLHSPSWRKMEMLAGLNASARALDLIGLRQRFPQASDAELHRRLADLLLGASLTEKCTRNRMMLLEPALGVKEWAK